MSLTKTEIEIVRAVQATGLVSRNVIKQTPTYLKKLLVKKLLAKDKASYMLGPNVPPEIVDPVEYGVVLAAARLNRERKAREKEEATARSEKRYAKNRKAACAPLKQRAKLNEMRTLQLGLAAGL